VLYELLTAGKLPFTADNQAALVVRILRGEYAVPDCNCYSKLLLSTLAACLALVGVSVDRRIRIGAKRGFAITPGNS